MRFGKRFVQMEIFQTSFLQNGSNVGLYLVDASSDGVGIERQPTQDPSTSHASVLENAACHELQSEWSSVTNLLDRAAVLFAFEQLLEG